jgi:hypothetical protein
MSDVRIPKLSACLRTAKRRVFPTLHAGKGLELTELKATSLGTSALRIGEWCFEPCLTAADFASLSGSERRDTILASY